MPVWRPADRRNAGLEAGGPTECRRGRRRTSKNAGVDAGGPLDVEVEGLVGPFHDEAEAG